MQFLRCTLADCAEANGSLIVIDVLRAFTTAAYAFEQGVREILLVGEVEEACSLRKRFPDALLLGEINGIAIEGFDLGNSPSELVHHDLRDKMLIQRTTAGTQGVVRAVKAKRILVCGLCNASATAEYTRLLQIDRVRFVLTGVLDGGWGDEDAACADWIEALLSGGRQVSPVNIAERVRKSRSGMHYDGTRTAFPPADLEMALAIDRFSFAMEVTREEGLNWLRRMPVE